MKKKLLLTSVMTIALCLCLIAGSTFALFTSNSKLNISATAGKVKMDASIADLTLWSVDADAAAGDDTDEIDEYGNRYGYVDVTADGKFANGGTAVLNGAVLTLSQVTPGDKVAFQVVGTNESDVTIQYRYIIECVEGLDELMGGLVVSINNTEYTCLKSYTSAWTVLTPNNSMPNVPVEIELPVTAGNEYQGDMAKIRVIVEAVQGNAVTEGAAEVVTFTVADDSAAIDDAIAAGEDTIVLGAGNYVVPDSAAGKTLTFVGNGDTVIATQDDGSYEGCDYSLDGATVTFENITINTDSTTYTGYARLNATYNNCTINGTYTLYGDSVFNDCTFNVTGDVYNIWTWGAENATFNNCTFNSDGKAVLLYGTVNANLTINHCTFNDHGGLTDLKAAIEIGDSYSKSYTLTVTNTVVNGYEINDKGIYTGTTLWGNKNSMGTDKLNVIVDGVDVY